MKDSRDRVVAVLPSKKTWQYPLVVLVAVGLLSASTQIPDSICVGTIALLEMGHAIGAAKLLLQG